MTEDDENRDTVVDFEPEAVGDEGDDPAQAFQALRQTVESLAGNLSREMTNIRKGVELALDRFEEIGPAADYRPEFGKVAQQLAAVAEHLQGVEQSPVLRNGPEHYARALERSGEGWSRRPCSSSSARHPTSSAPAGTSPAIRKAPMTAKARIFACGWPALAGWSLAYS